MVSFYFAEYQFVEPMWDMVRVREKVRIRVRIRASAMDKDRVRFEIQQTEIWQVEIWRIETQQIRLELKPALIAQNIYINSMMHRLMNTNELSRRKPIQIADLLIPL